VHVLRGEPANANQLEQRRRDLAAAESFDPPASYGVEPPIPPLDVFPATTRQAMEILLYATEKVFEPEQSNRREAAGSKELKGIGAARVSYSGPARVIMGEDQFDRIQPGDVLVCPITSPVWSILFAKVGALVTDSGGILSHPAIIAREYGIPAVVATGNATQIIPDGQQVTVDGNTGLVQVVG
jgi:pyruvate,water dikinase